jgi:hypothetical protein
MRKTYMNERFEKWLDEQLERIIYSGKVEFNIGRWKQKFSDAYQTLVLRAVKNTELQELE